MRKKTFYRAIFIFSVLTLLTGVVFGVLILLTENPPEKELALAQKSISEAKRAKAGEYAPDLFNRAESNYAAAMRKMRIENLKWIVSRDYDGVKASLESSINYAQKSIAASKNASVSVNEYLEKTYKRVDDRIDAFDSLIKLIPLPKSVRENYNKGKFLLSESKLAFGQKSMLDSKEKLQKASVLIFRAIDYSEMLVKNYFGAYPLWQRRVQEAIQYSRRNNTSVIVVDKFGQQLTVYRNGESKAVFQAELGQNWIGEKQYGGDKATPEGTYKVTQKLMPRQTTYYKALMINYPNDEDKRRFAEAKRKGLISKGASIGSMIEIHGGGGQGVNWTNGCVALHNSDMDKLFGMIDVEVGTLVVIVGSTKPLEEVLQKESI